LADLLTITAVLAVAIVCASLNANRPILRRPHKTGQQGTPKRDCRRLCKSLSGYVDASRWLVRSRATNTAGPADPKTGARRFDVVRFGIDNGSFHVTDGNSLSTTSNKDQQPESNATPSNRSLKHGLELLRAFGPGATLRGNGLSRVHWKVHARF
jgi:hypothetical protein